MSVKLEPTEADIAQAAWAWRNDRDRETDGSDQAYFIANWETLPGLRAYVRTQVEIRQLGQVLHEALAGRAALDQGVGEP